MAGSDILTDPERALALAYAPAPARGRLASLWALDERLAAIHAAARDPAIAQMRLIWWRDALAALDVAPPPAEPLLRTLHATLADETGGAALAGLAEGWAALLDGVPPDDAALEEHARLRGAGLFVLAARALGAEPPADVARAGELWSLVDLARRLGGEPADRASAAARRRLGPGGGGRWPAALRPIGMLAALAVADLRGAAPVRQGSPSRVFRMALHRLTGRVGLGAPPARA